MSETLVERLRRLAQKVESISDNKGGNLTVGGQAISIAMLVTLDSPLFEEAVAHIEALEQRLDAATDAIGSAVMLTQDLVLVINDQEEEAKLHQARDLLRTWLADDSNAGQSADKAPIASSLSKARETTGRLKECGYGDSPALRMLDEKLRRASQSPEMGIDK